MARRNLAFPWANTARGFEYFKWLIFPPPGPHGPGRGGSDARLAGRGACLLLETAGCAHKQAAWRLSKLHQNTNILDVSPQQPREHAHMRKKSSHPFTHTHAHTHTRARARDMWTQSKYYKWSETQQSASKINCTQTMCQPQCQCFRNANLSFSENPKSGSVFRPHTLRRLNANHLGKIV